MKNIKLLYLLFLTIILLFGVISFAHALPINKTLTSNHKIYLESRQFIPDKGLSISKTDKTHFLIQLEHFPTKEEKEILERKGIKFLAYIPNNAWFVSIDNYYG